MEAELLNHLVDGCRPQKSIPMPKSTCYEAAKKLEAQGMLLRNQDGWTLTRAGLHHAVSQGIMPTPRPVFDLTDEVLPSDEFPLIPTMHRFTPKVDKWWRLKHYARFVLFLIWLHLVVVLIMHYTGYANIW